MHPIGHISSCYQEKFGIPRQAGLVNEASSVLVLPRTTSMLQAIAGLEEYSHIWVIFCFHERKGEGWKARVRPPRLGGDKTAGVFATRSPYRPNPLGLSAVALTHIEQTDTAIRLHLRGGDFLDGTPVLDIKPYLPYCDAIPTAHGAWAAEAPPQDRVEFSAEAEAELTAYFASRPPGEREAFAALIRATLALDPRPSYQRRRESSATPTADGPPAAAKTWTMRLAAFADFDISWQRAAGGSRVTKILKLKSKI